MANITKRRILQNGVIPMHTRGARGGLNFVFRALEPAISEIENYKTANPTKNGENHLENLDSRSKLPQQPLCHTTPMTGFRPYLRPSFPVPGATPCREPPPARWSVRPCLHLPQPPGETRPSLPLQRPQAGRWSLTTSPLSRRPSAEFRV